MSSTMDRKTLLLTSLIVSVLITSPPTPAVSFPGDGAAPGPMPPWFDGGYNHIQEHDVKELIISSLVDYGGYKEVADALANLTSLAEEIGRLAASEGHSVTLLAPNDEAMGRLRPEQLEEGDAVERILYHHIVPEYQTEESFYFNSKGHGRRQYPTLRGPHRLVAAEDEARRGVVRLVGASGQGGGAYILDPDMYADGRVSVQGIDALLFPPEE